MRTSGLILILMLFCWANKTSAQEIMNYKWKNRVLVVLTEKEDHTLYQKQITDLKSVQPGLDERKVLVITLTPNFQLVGINSTEKQKPQLNYSKLKATESDFEVILFGLDGNTKLRQEEILKHKDLFALIDSMPMRQNEIQKN